MAKGRRLVMVLLAIGSSVFLLVGAWTALAGVNDGNYSNYMDNGDFDGALSPYWTVTSGSAPAFTRVTGSNCFGGSGGCLSATTNVSTSDDFVEQFVSIGVTGQANFSGQLQTTGFGSLGSFVHVRLIDPNGSTLITLSCIPITNPCSNSWTNRSANATITQTGEYLVQITADVANLATAYIDHLTLTIDGQGPPLVKLLDPMLWGASPECPSCSTQNAVGWVGGPINTRTGNLSYQETDLSTPVQGSALEFRRSYASQAVEVYTSTMGHGWTHNYDMRLHFEGNALTETVELQAAGGSRLPFFDNGDGTFSPYPGVTAQLSRITTTNPITTQYVVTAFNQMLYTFDADGLLQEQEDAAGNVITFTHNTVGQLTQASQGARSLSYAYDPTTGYLSSVTDNAGRSVELGYESGNLTVVTDTLGLATTHYYSATVSPYLLTEVVDPSGVTLELTAYDDQGRATRQWDGAGNLLVDIDFTLTNTHVITENGVVMTHTYDARGTLVDRTFSCADGTTGCGSGTGKAYDYNFKASEVVDANGNATSLAWDAGGSNLQQVTDALNNTTGMTYDALNNLTQVVNARGLTTTYSYDNATFPTFRTGMTDALGHTTIYTPTAGGLLAAEQDANGNITTYDYNTFGQVIQVVQAAGTGEAVTTTYDYDAVGRLQATTESAAGESHTTLNAYDDGDRLVAIIANWTGSNPINWVADCDKSSGPRDTNVCTQYGYDAAGRTISTTNSLGQTDLTFYESAGRVEATVSNWDGSAYTSYGDLCNFTSPDPEYNVCSLTDYDAAGRVISTTNALGQVTRTFYDSLGRVAGTVQNSVSVTSLAQCAFPPASPDQDLCTTHEYDAAGNTIVVKDAVGRETRTFYDELNRVEATVQNWSGSITDPAQCAFPPTQPDADLCTVYEYDEVGNTTVVTDPLGRQTRTFYDALNRVEGTVQNWQAGFTLASCFDAGQDPQRDENVCTLYEYDDAGNQVTVTDAKNNKRHTVYDSANRPVVQVQNWDGTTAIEADGAGCADTAANPNADENLCSFTDYDALGRRASVTDVLDNVTEFAYDGLGRVVTTTRYLDGQPVQTSTSFDVSGNRLSETDANGHTTTYSYDSLNRLQTTTSHEGVTTDQTYNAAGWVLSTTDGLNHSTTNSYDDVGRLLSTTDPENNTTQYEYDAAGNQVAMVDAEGVRTGYGYDDLDRLAAVTENETGGAQTNESNLLTQYAYDALGNRTVITNARGYSVTLTVYDGLNRPVTAYDALGNSTQYTYDLVGNRTVITDANGAVTNYAYDELSRLITTTYTADGITVGTQYDAAGNRTQMVDDVGTTIYQYDDFYRLITVTNPITGSVAYGYDDAGNRARLIYPGGREVVYTYDGDNRLVEVEDWNQDLTRYGYDGAGRLITTTLPNGVQTTYGYDDANRLLSLQHVSAGDTILARYLYTLDGVGNRVAVTETLAAPGTSVLAALPQGAYAEAPWTDAGDVLAALDFRLFGAQLKPLSELQSPGVVQNLEIVLSRETLSADGRDSALVVVLATDANGRPVPDGTRLILEAQGGRLTTHQVQTSNGLAYAPLRAGQMHGRGQVTVRAGETSASALFRLQSVEDEVLRLDEGEAIDTPQTGEGRGTPFNVAELVERARNAIRLPQQGRPQVETPAHRATFGEEEVQFTPLEENGEQAPALTVTLSGVIAGAQTLFAGPQEAAALVEGNVARYERAPGLVEEFLVRDAGVEQRWWLDEAPAITGELVITVDVETALILARAPRGEGFLFRATGDGRAVAAYGRAVAIDANGRSLRADLSSETLAPTTPGLNRYRLIMRFDAEWLAGAGYPLLVDPLIGSRLRLDGTQTQGGAQRRTAVAYNSVDDEYLIVWEDDRDVTTRIYGQRVSAEGLLLGNNFTIASNNSRHYLAPDVAYNADDNNYLVSWHADNGPAFARTVTAAGSTGPIRSLVTSGYTTNSNTAVAYSAGAGNWLVVWQRTNSSTSSEDVGARWVDSDGNLGTAFAVAESSSVDETAPDVSANGSGGFLVAWEEEAGSSVDLYARRTTTTAVDGSAFALSTADGAQVAPALIYNPDDDHYLAAWQDWSDGAGGSGADAIWGQRVYGTSTGGTLLGGAFEISGAEDADSSRPAVTYFENSGSGGLYLVAWEQTVSGAALDLQARRVLTDGTTTGSVITLNNTLSDQQDVALGFGPMSGQTLAAWIDERQGDPDVYARLAQFDGSLRDEFLVHTAAGDQEAPQVAYNTDDDEYLVVWHDYRNGAENGDIYGQRVDGSGALVGSNITVTTAAYDQLYPQVAYAPGQDTYLVAWRSYISDTIYYDVAGQRLATDGSLLGGQLLIGDSDGALYRDGPSDVVYNSASDKFLVLWEETDGQARHVALNGAMDAAFEVTDETGVEYGLRAAYNPDEDQYLVVWEHWDPVNAQYNVLGRRMTGAGVVTGTETIAIATGAPDQTAPDVAYLANAGRYVVVWQDARNSGASGNDVYGQLVTPAGGLEGGNFQVAGAAQDEEASKIEADGQGGALVVWQHETGGADGYDLYSRRLDDSGQLIGEAFSILLSAEDQDQPALASNGDGQLFLAWRDARNGGLDVYGSLFHYLQADFSATPTSGTAPLEVQFTDESTPAGAADEWQWGFGDGGTSAAQHPVYTYTTPGTYTVTLTITNTTTSETDALVQTDFITVTESAALTAAFSGTPTSGASPLQVSFTDESTPNGAADAWQWDFGDGGTSTAQHPSHNYQTPGVYTVTLTITDTGSSQNGLLVRSSYITVDFPASTPENAITTTITYDYDALYRLTGAQYTDSVTATYSYDYDAVGNITAFTETVDSVATVVTRTFDAANRLETGFVDEHLYNYIYDNNGNLLKATYDVPPPSIPGGEVGKCYGYDQRNLLRLVCSIGSVNHLEVEYDYDGDGNRLRQIDNTSASPITTTYTNDIVGLTQVLVADDGTDQVYNLFGLDLIEQDDGSVVRTLLVDGLGSVRLETVNGSVVAVTTYSPYGEVLEQTGTSGTVYGFTGETYDEGSELLYLRARYYDSALKVFQSRDLWKGSGWRPGTLNYYTYGLSNPVNWIDPSGHYAAQVDTSACAQTNSCPTLGALSRSKDPWQIIKEQYEPGLDLNFGPPGSLVAQQYGEAAIGPFHAVFGEDTEIFLSDLFLEAGASIYLGIGIGTCAQVSLSDPSGINLEFEGGRGIGIEVLDVGLEVKKVAVARTDGTVSLEYSFTGFIFSVADGIQVDPDTLIVRPTGTLLTDELARGNVEAWTALWDYIQSVVPTEYVYLGVVLPHPDFPDYYEGVPVYLANPLTVDYPEITVP